MVKVELLHDYLGSILVSVDLKEIPPLRANDQAADPECVVVHKIKHLVAAPPPLDLACKFNGQAETWTCYNRQLIDVYFSLPNAAVLLGL